MGVAQKLVIFLTISPSKLIDHLRLTSYSERSILLVITLSGQSASLHRWYHRAGSTTTMVVKILYCVNTLFFQMTHLTDSSFYSGRNFFYLSHLVVVLRFDT